MNEAVAHIAHQCTAPQQQRVDWRCLALEQWAKCIVRRHMLQSSSAHSFLSKKSRLAAGRARTCEGYPWLETPMPSVPVCQVDPDSLSNRGTARPAACCVASCPVSNRFGWQHASQQSTAQRNATQRSAAQRRAAPAAAVAAAAAAGRLLYAVVCNPDAMSQSSTSPTGQSAASTEQPAASVRPQQCAGLRARGLLTVDAKRMPSMREPMAIAVGGALGRPGPRLPSSFSQAESCSLLLLRPPPSFLLVRPFHFPRRRWGYSFNSVLFRLQFILSLAQRIFPPIQQPAT
jgi:hypothetical protein